MELAGSTMVLGFKPRASAIALAGMLVPTTVAAHRFWKEEDTQTRSQQRTHFFKNAATLGALLEIAAFRAPGGHSTRTQRVPE